MSEAAASERNDSGIGLSPVESVAYFLGILKVCALLENAAFPGLESAPIAWEDLKRRLLVVVEHLKLDSFLSSLAPDEPLFKESIIERSASDPVCFVSTQDRLREIRKTRGSFVEPQSSEGVSGEESGNVADLSSLENLSRLIGMFAVLDFYEQATYVHGALPEATHRKIVTLVLMEVHKALLALDTLSGHKVVQMKIPNTEGSDAAIEPIVVGLTRQMLADQRFCGALRHNLTTAHKDLFPVLAEAFVNKFFASHQTTNAQGHIQGILHALQLRLAARQEAVEKFQYYRLETIDKNCEHLLATLKQYGIKATTYEEARKAYERQFVPSAPPQNVRDRIRQRIHGRVRSRVELQQDCMEEIRLNPEYEEYIREEYQTEIDELKD